MIEIPANPDIEILKMWLGALIAIMLLLLGVVGYFLSRRDQAITGTMTNLNKVVDQLEIVVGNIRVEQDIRQPILTQQLENHRLNIEANAKNIELIDKRLTVIETQHKDAYCRFPAQKKKGEQQ
jgi:hypothetical protein